MIGRLKLAYGVVRSKPPPHRKTARDSVRVERYPLKSLLTYLLTPDLPSALTAMQTPSCGRHGAAGLQQRNGTHGMTCAAPKFRLVPNVCYSVQVS